MQHRPVNHQDKNDPEDEERNPESPGMHDKLFKPAINKRLCAYKSPCLTHWGRWRELAITRAARHRVEKNACQSLKEQRRQHSAGVTLICIFPRKNLENI